MQNYYFYLCTLFCQYPSSEQQITSPCMSLYPSPILQNNLLLFQFPNANNQRPQVLAQTPQELLPQVGASTRNTEEHQKVQGEAQKRIIKKRTPQKELESSRKNGESNIANQLFSHFCNVQKSQKLLQKAIKLLKRAQAQFEKIKSIFYIIVRTINFRRGRKYVNKETIKSYYKPSTYLNTFPDMLQKMEEVGILSLEEFCFLFRVCTFHFLKNTSIQAILTSRRISVIAKLQHLKKCRKFVEFLQVENE